ncbi:MAG TPA: hypothetical protein VE673_15685 [Pseudonocardiaceae bacterium]|nr:hypothetical protein [Pseudonocardiaceae bacterium]
MSSWVGEAITADVASHEAAPPWGWAPWTTPPAAGHDGSSRDGHHQDQGLIL